MEKFMSPKE